MKAEEFIGIWEGFMKAFFKEGESIRELWKKDAEWTRNVIGQSHAKSEGSPLGEKLKESLGNDWRYRTEEWKLDLVLTKKQNWPTPKDWLEEKWQSEWDKTFWPATYEIIVEHETSGGISWQEMVKLIHLRSRLKVLITYTYDLPDPDNQEGRSQELIDRIREQFQIMLKEAWNNFPENWDTEYLLIVGQLGENSDTVKWHYSVFAPSGIKVCDDSVSEIKAPNNEA